MQKNKRKQPPWIFATGEYEFEILNQKSIFSIKSANCLASVWVGKYILKAVAVVRDNNSAALRTFCRSCGDISK